MAKSVLITGASRGLGAHLAQHFWAADWSLILVSRDVEGLNGLSKAFQNKRGQTYDLMPYNLAEPAEVGELCEIIKSKHNSLDALINNAAIQGPIGPLVTNNYASWMDVIKINLLAPVAICRNLIPLLIEGQNPSIINLSGGGATAPRPNFSAYASSKAALVRFSETLAEELKPLVTVNCIAPGAMKTRMLEEILDSSKSPGNTEVDSAKKVIAGGGASMERVAELALFLTGEKSRGISGKLISAIWDNWEAWPDNLNALNQSDIYTLRRIVGRDRGIQWGDK